MRILIALCFVTFTSGWLIQSTYAQDLPKYVGSNAARRPYTYAPGDPWTRGPLYKLQTGNGGLFFNCDGEEDKRNSPYICWKTKNERDIPPRRGFWNGIKIDVSQVRQRIRDGAGDCCQPGCRCAKCSRKNKVPASHCQTCQATTRANPGTSLAATETTVESSEINNVEISNELTQRQNLPTENDSVIQAAPKYGLIKGNLAPPKSKDAIETTVAEPKSRFAGTIEQLIRKR